MKTILLIAMILAFAQDKPADSPLVKAAKANGGPKKKITKKVIPNADVKKSHGKLIVLPPKEAQAATPAPAAPQKTSLEKQQEQRKAADAAAVRVGTAEKKVADLEKDLRRIEDSYYAENDLNYRDNTIQPRFAQTKKQLDDARRELSDARDAQQKANTKSP